MAFSYGPLWGYIAARNITQKELANRIGVSRSTLGKMRRCENINTNILDRICNCLDCHIEEITVHIPDKENKEEK